MYPHWLRNLLDLNFERTQFALVTTVVVLGVWRTFIMLVQFMRPGAVRRFYPLYVPVTLSLITALLYIPPVRTFPAMYPQWGLIALVVISLAIMGLMALQGYKYVRSFFPGGTTPHCKWYKAWPLRALRGTLPFTLSWVISTLTLAIFLRELAVACQYLADMGKVEVIRTQTLAQTIAEYSMNTADSVMEFLPVVLLVWLVITFVLLVIRKIGDGIRGIANRGHGHP